MKAYQEAIKIFEKHYDLVVLPLIKQKAYDDAAKGLGVVIPQIREDALRSVPRNVIDYYNGIITTAQDFQSFLGNSITDDGIKTFSESLEECIREFNLALVKERVTDEF